MLTVIDRALGIAVVLGSLVLASAYAARWAFFGGRRAAVAPPPGSSVLLGDGASGAIYWLLGSIARRLVRARVGANALTTASLGFGFLAAGAFATGFFGIASVLTTASALSDGLDGLVARATRTASAGGELFDAVVDRYVEVSLFAGLALFYREHAAWLSLSLLALLGAFMVSYGSAKAQAHGMAVPGGAMRRPERAFCLIEAAALSAALGPDLVPAWAPATPMLVALALIGVIGNLSAIRRLRLLASSLSRAGSDPRPASARPRVDLHGGGLS